MELDRLLTEYDFRERHSIRMAAAPGTVLREAVGSTPRDVPLMVALMAVRTLPALLAGRRRLGIGSGSIAEQFERAGFVRLAQTEEEVVIGAIGRFWHPSGDLRRVPAVSRCCRRRPGSPAPTPRPGAASDATGG